MFNEIWSRLLEFLRDNQFASGGVMLGVIASVGYYIRAVPGRVGRWLFRRLVTEVEILDTDEAFVWVMAWLIRNKGESYMNRRSTITTSVGSYYRGGNNTRSEPTSTPDTTTDGEPPKTVEFIPSPGKHLIRYGRHFLVFGRTREDVIGRSGARMEYRESLKVWTVASRQVVTRLVEEARIESVTDEPQMTVYQLRHGSWCIECKRSPRGIDTVVCRDNESSDILADIRNFYTQRQWYVDRGVPWRRGYLLYGPPGCGKTSLIASLASELKIPIGIIQLNSYMVDDSDLARGLSGATGKLVVLEDVDTVEASGSRDKSDDHKDNDHYQVSLGGLLNAIDGIQSGEGYVLFMTTNHPEKLDPALIRPGRVDLRVEIGYVTRDQARRMFCKFFPDHTALADEFASSVTACGDVSPAQIQGHLIQFLHDPKSSVPFVVLQEGSQSDLASLEAA